MYVGMFVNKSVKNAFMISNVSANTKSITIVAINVRTGRISPGYLFSVCERKVSKQHKTTITRRKRIPYSI